MDIEEMLAAFINKESRIANWCQLESYEVSGDQITIQFSFPAIQGRKSGEVIVSLLEIMAWLWSTIPE